MQRGKIAAFIAVMAGAILIHTPKAGAVVEPERAQKVVTDIVTLYDKQITETLGEEIALYLNWQDPRFLAAVGNFQYVTLGITGGVIGQKEMTEDILALITCHEVGHLLAGEPAHLSVGPKIVGDMILPRFVLMSYEGQADYFATNQCMKRYLGQKSEEENLAALPVKGTSKVNRRDLLAFCAEQKFTGNDQAICARIVRAVQRSGDFLARLNRIHHPDWRDESKLRPRKTNERHPGPQCRVTTYMAGLLNAERPRCWYNEKYEQAKNKIELPEPKLPIIVTDDEKSAAFASQNCFAEAED